MLYFGNCLENGVIPRFSIQREHCVQQEITAQYARKNNTLTTYTCSKLYLDARKGGVQHKMQRGCTAQYLHIKSPMGGAG